MTFDDILGHVHRLLQRQGRVSYRARKRRFNLDSTTAFPCCWTPASLPLGRCRMMAIVRHYTYGLMMLVWRPTINVSRSST
jgi:hypothetical protein